MKNHLLADETAWLLDEKRHPGIPAFNKSRHMPNQLAWSMMERVQALYRKQTITDDQLIFLQTETSLFLDVCGACERIKKTPIPYSYREFIKNSLCCMY